MVGEGGRGPDPCDVVTHGHPGGATPVPDPGPPTAEQIAAVAAAAGVQLPPHQCALIVACAVDGPGPPWPVGTVLAPPDPADPTVWVRAGEDDDGWFEVDPRQAETYAWVLAGALPAHPAVLRRGPDVAR